MHCRCLGVCGGAPTRAFPEKDWGRLIHTTNFYIHLNLVELRSENIKIWLENDTLTYSECREFFLCVSFFLKNIFFHKYIVFI